MAESSPSLHARPAGPEQLVLFDIDGTLLSAGGVSGRAIERALTRRLGAPPDLTDYSYAGRTDPQIVRDLLLRGGLTGAAVDASIPIVLDDYIDDFRQAVRGATTPHLYPGVRPLLAELAADSTVCLGLLTGNVAPGAAIKLEHLGIGHHFRFGAFGSDSEDRNALVTVAARRARDRTGVDFGPERMLVVGDTPRDIACARAHGARCILVATGTCDVTTLGACEPDALFKDFSDTVQVLAAIRACRPIAGA